MRTARLMTWLAAVAALAALLPQDASAIPAFARKYGVNCTMCHSSFPRLNDFGARFRANGYRLPGRESIERTVLESPTPVALRTSAGYDHVEGRAPDDWNTFEVKGLDVLSGGLLGPRIGYFLVFVPGISEGRGVAGQEASLEMASLVFSNVGKTTLTLRAGRFEPAYTAFSVKRQLSVSPYEVYGYSFQAGPTYSDAQSGIEARCGGYGALRAAAGLVAGSDTNRPKDLPQDAYLRLEGVLGPGEGQTAGQRLGIVGSVGHARPDASLSTGGDGLESFSRIGADAALNAQIWSLALQYLWARDNGPLWGKSDDVTWSGGFAEMTCTPSFRFTGFSRYDLLRRPSFFDGSIWRFTVGGRYHFEDNVAVHIEYSHRARSADNALLEDFATARLDMAF